MVGRRHQDGDRSSQAEDLNDESMLAEPNRPLVIPSGGPKGRRRGIAIVPSEGPGIEVRPTADADYADCAVALRANAETANCASRRFKGSEHLEAFQRLRGERLSTTLTP